MTGISLRATRFCEIQILSAILASCLIGLFAQIRIPLPFTPIPLTGQTFGVMLVRALLVLCKLKYCNNFDVKAAIIDDRNLIRIGLIRINLRSLRSSILVELSHSKLDQDFSLQSTRAERWASSEF